MGAGLLVTVVFLWLFLRDVPFRDVAQAIAGTRWGVLLGLSIPAYVFAVYLRALRWRHLIDPIQSIPTAPLFRAVAIGFMANNIFPLRMGELARCWYLARETGANTAAVFGTVMLERALDIVTVVALALGAFAVWGGEGEGVIARGAVWLLPAAAVPILVLAGLRAAPERVIAAGSGPWPPSQCAFRASPSACCGALAKGSELFAEGGICSGSPSILSRSGWSLRRSRSWPAFSPWGSDSIRRCRPSARRGSPWRPSESP